MVFGRTRSARAWPDIPGEVRHTLRRPLLARIYRDLAKFSAWHPTNEYELCQRYWNRLDEDGSLMSRSIVSASNALRVQSSTAHRTRGQRSNSPMLGSTTVPSAPNRTRLVKTPAPATIRDLARPTSKLGGGRGPGQHFPVGENWFDGFLLAPQEALSRAEFLRR